MTVFNQAYLDQWQRKMAERARYESERFPIRVQLLRQEIEERLNKGVPKSPLAIVDNPLIIKNPRKLPPIGTTYKELNTRINAVKASMREYPNKYKKGWGLKLAKEEFLDPWVNVRDWCIVFHDAPEYLKEHKFDALLGLAAYFAQHADSLNDRCQRGMIAGIHDEPGRCGTITRWVNFRRLARFIGLENNEMFRQMVLDYSNICIMTDPRYYFESYLQAYGDLENSTWESFTL